jgi:hypothetical protein
MKTEVIGIEGFINRMVRYMKAEVKGTKGIW